MSQDCRWDADCNPDNTALKWGDCNASALCTPLAFQGYSAVFPGEIYGSKKGYADALSAGKEFQLFNDMGLFQFYVAVDGETSLTVPKWNDQDEATITARMLSASYIPRRLENCNGQKGSPGVDCDGPPDTLNMRPLSDGVPVYGSFPFISPLGSKPEASNKGQLQDEIPYKVADRVVVKDCTGHSWCSDSVRKHNHLYVEPTTGFPLSSALGWQFNMRIKSPSRGPMMMFPNVDTDLMIPWVWFSLHWKAPPATLRSIAKLQSLPDELDFTAVASISGGIAVLLLGILVMLVGITLIRKGKIDGSKVCTDQVCTTS